VAIVKPFRALRPLPEQAAKVSAVPYDVVNVEEARELADGNPLSFLHVSRPEIDLPEGTDPHSDTVYEHAAVNFDRLIVQAPLIIEDEPAYYFYRLSMGSHEQTGIVACCSLDEYDNDIIRKHERTRKEKEDDRTRHIRTLRAQTGPVFITYKPSETIDALALKVAGSEPLFGFRAPDGVIHTIWKVDSHFNSEIAEAFAHVPYLYIADGHHRAKSASRVREELRAEEKKPNGTDDYNFFQCVLFPADQVKILAYNRVIRDLGDATLKDVMDKIDVDFELEDTTKKIPDRRGRYAMYANGSWYSVKLRKEVTKPIKAVDGLDVTILQEKLLEPVLGIEDPRTDQRVDFVGGIRGPEAIEQLVDSGKAAIGFTLFPTTVGDLMQISDAGEIMPPKSTWFEPKLRDGLLSHLI